MKISLNWLKNYIPVDTAPEELAEALTMTGLEVEAMFDRFARDDIVAGRVIEAQPHPGTDSLTACRVDVGGKTVPVVCGAPNVQIGGLYPCAMPGASLAAGETVEKTKIRGAPSEGMLCSARELGAGSNGSKLLELDPQTAEGTPAARALELSDTILEIGLTPNRPDCLSFIGVAREVAAITGRELILPELEIPPVSGAISRTTSVTIQNPEHCPRYAARLVTGITVAPSPFWLQDRLYSIGLKPVNNIVDITNFVMMETGQPLHAFDFDRLSGGRIVVRTAEEAEAFTTLDGREHKLTSDTLMICDAEKPVAVAGVMGGENSEIRQQTCRVLIESACFDPVSIRKTAKRMGISTDASHRFERGVDPEGTLYALERAARLMAEIGNGTLVEGAIDEYPKPLRRQPILFDTEKANHLLGTSIAASQMQELLESVDFAATFADETHLRVLPPSFRVDVSRPEDLMEEVARLWGYNRIITTFPGTSAPTKLAEREIRLRETVKDLMCGFGFTEAINYSFAAKDSCRRLELPPEDERQRMLGVLNPLSEEQAVMRTSLLPGLLEAVRKNIAHQVKDLKLFETGRTFLSRGQDRLPEETETLAALWTGLRMPPTWQTKPECCDFYDIKGAAESLLERLYVENPSFRPLTGGQACYTRPGHSARIFAGETEIGLIGEMAPQVLANFDLKQQCFILEINLQRLLPLVPEVRPFSPIPKFPAVSRDITLIVDSSIPAGDIVASIYQTGEALLEQARIFDLYSGAPIPEGSKSVSIRLVYRSARETLADETVNRIHDEITRHLMQTFHASLPA